MVIKTLKNCSASILLLLSFFILLCYTHFSRQLSLRQLTFSDTAHDGDPDWSPLGQSIAFSSARSGYCAAEVDFDDLRNRLNIN